MRQPEREYGYRAGNWSVWSCGHEGRRARLGRLNVVLSAFHEGRGARKSTIPGGHRLVSRKRIVSEKEKAVQQKLQEKEIFGKVGVPSCFTVSEIGLFMRETR